MQYIMSMNAPVSFPIPTSYDEEPSGNWSGGQDDGWGHGDSRQRGRGFRGSFGRGFDYNNGRGGRGGRGGGWDQHTDALTLAGGDDPEPHPVAFHGYTQEHSGPHEVQPSHEDLGSGSPAKTGKMQRVGDKWVFVRAEGVA